METMLVVDADARRRAAIARAVATRRPDTRLLPAASWAEARRRLADARPAGRVVALTDDMSPDTLIDAEAAGVSATLRTPPDLQQLETVLGFLDDRGDVWS